MGIEYGSPAFKLPPDVAFLDKFQVFTQNQVFSEGLQAISPNGNSRISVGDNLLSLEGRLGRGPVQFVTAALNVTNSATSNILVLPTTAVADVALTFSTPVAETAGYTYLLINLSSTHRFTLTGVLNTDGTTPAVIGPGRMVVIQEIGDGTGNAVYYVVDSQPQLTKSNRGAVATPGTTLTIGSFNGVTFALRNVGGNLFVSMAATNSTTQNCIAMTQVFTATGVSSVNSTTPLPNTNAFIDLAALGASAPPTTTYVMGTIDMGATNRRIFNFAISIGSTLNASNTSGWITEITGD